MTSDICMRASFDVEFGVDDIAKAKQTFQANGALVVRNALSGDLVKKLCAAFMKDYANKALDKPSSFVQRVGDRRYMYTVRMAPPFDSPAILASPVILSLARAWLGGDCLIQSVNLVSSQPGAKKQFIHRDYPSLFPNVEGLNAMLPAYAVHCGIPLEGLNQNIGTTALWLGSHRNLPNPYDAYTQEELDGLKGASLSELEVGDIYFMDARLRHCGTPNQSSIDRPILYIVFCRPWFIDAVNFGVQYPLWIENEDFSRFSDEIKNLFQMPKFAFNEVIGKY